MPMDITEFFFNNWTAIKAHYHLYFLNSEFACSERERLFYSVLLDGIVVKSLEGRLAIEQVLSNSVFKRRLVDVSQDDISTN